MKVNQKTITAIGATFIILLAFSCQKTDLTKGSMIEISGQSSSQLKTTLNGEKTWWASGDQIGVFCDEATNSSLGNITGVNNQLFVPTDYPMVSSSFSSATAMYWGTENHDFYAYYPWDENGIVETAIPLSLSGSQVQIGGSNGHISALDFTYAKLLNVIPQTSVKLDFDHAFALVEFKFTATTLSLTTNDKIYGIQLNGNGRVLAFTGGTINIQTGVITLPNVANRQTSCTVDCANGLQLSDTNPNSLYMMVYCDPTTGLGSLSIGIKTTPTGAYNTAGHNKTAITFLPGHTYVVTGFNN